MCVCACIYGVCQCAQVWYVLETRKWLWDLVQTLCCLHLSIASDLMPRALCELTHGLLGNFLPQLLSCHRRTETTHVHQHVSFLHGLKGSNTYCRLLLQLLLLIEPSARSFHNRKRGGDVKGRWKGRNSTRIHHHRCQVTFKKENWENV